MSGIRIIGIDPGYAIVGWGALEYMGGNLKAVDYGSITTSAELPFSRRLGIIYEELTEILERLKPVSMGVEKLYFTKNQTTGIDVAGARGVIMLCAERHGLSIGEYTPLQVKQAVVGYGKAEKKQVMQMTKMLLGLEQLPKPDDTADALAVAICHAHTAGLRGVQAAKT